MESSLERERGKGDKQEGDVETVPEGLTCDSVGRVFGVLTS